MDALNEIVARAQQGDADAFALVLRRFQDMAVGYSHSMLHDFQLAEDAAQEAFFEAFRTLPKLREPAAFAGWFRRIVFKQCDRITRRQAVVTVPLDGAVEPVQPRGDEERKAQVIEAMRHLPDHERSTMTLFYIGGYSMGEVATFLEVPVSTIKGRLHSARERLRTMLVDSVADDLRARRPSRNESFATAVLDLLKAARAGDADRVKALLKADPRLLVARDPMGNTALIMAVNSGHDALADLLYDAGVEPDFHEAAAIGDVTRVRAALERNSEQLDTHSPEGFTALALAAHFGHLDVMRWLIDRGADLNRVALHRLAVTPAPRRPLRPTGRGGALADRARR
jgi:RNA polymerase sigma factor (sigma-70 family)